MINTYSNMRFDQKVFEYFSKRFERQVLNCLHCFFLIAKEINKE